MLLTGIKLKKVILLILVLCLLPLVSAQVERYIYSSADEVKEIINNMCDNPDLEVSCHPFPRYELVSDEYIITGYDPTFNGYLAVDFIEGNFSGDNLQEGLLVAGNPEADWYPQYILIQKNVTGWIPILPDTDKTHFLGTPYAIVQGAERDSVITLSGGLQLDEIFGAFRIYTTKFEGGISEIETLFQMPQIHRTWYLCNSFQDGVVSKAIDDGSLLANFDGFRQKDIDNNGFKDLILDISVRYWEDQSIYTKYDALDCEAIYFSLPVENHEVIFTFDGYTFTPHKNVEWLQHIYTSEK